MPFKSNIFGNTSSQNALEPMQIDIAAEENENATEDPLVEVSTAAIDLDVYTAAYKGLGRLYRLVFVADHCRPLRVEALQLALSHVHDTLNVSLYQSLHRKMQEAVASGQNLPDVTGQSSAVGAASVLDQQWIDSRSKRAALKLEKLDSDLKNYKANSIKESIRRGHDDLGDHYMDCGDLGNALKCYSRSRDYCTSGRHVVNMCLNVAKVSAYLQHWAHVSSYVIKAEMTACDNEPAGWQDTVHTQLNLLAGLAHLRHANFEAAARAFIKCSFDHCELPELLSASNVAVYAGLCALATFSRQQLRAQLLASASFKLFLELEPQLRDALQLFYDSCYAQCLHALHQLRDSLLLDIYLSKYVEQLYAVIRNRALIQYFSPYASADLQLMSQAFSCSVSELEDEIITLILDGQIQARIDSHNKILYVCSVDERRSMFERALTLGNDYIKHTRALLLRSAIHRAQLCVKANAHDGASQNGASVGNTDGMLD